jgi:formate dehydrogenase subunit gamma
MTDREDVTFIRFVLSQRIEHILLVISFGMLCLTGLPQKFHDTVWAQWIMSALGGIGTTRIIHHIFAFMLAFEFLYHLIVIVYELLLVRRRPLPMLPRLQDVRDGLSSVAYLSGLRPEKPQFDRYDFKQKVEYWALIWGLLVMGGTGLILMFPVVATRYLPGVLIPTAKVAHGYEAILAFLAIITWHLYNAHLSSGAFPLDTSIFTGKVSGERMLEEHPLEYQRLTMSQSEATSEDSAGER